MKIRGLLVMLAVLIGLALFVYFYEIQGGKSRTEREKAEKKIFQVDQSNIQEVALFVGDREIRAKREKEQWKIIQPLETAADQHEWDSISRGLSNLAKEKDLGLQDDVASFGLKSPRLRIALKDNEGKEREVLFGDDNPTESYVYVKTPQSSSILLVPSSSYRLFDRKLFDLRDKSVLKAEQDEVREITLRNPKGTIQLQKLGEEWQVKSPLETKAEKSEITSFLGSITSSRVKELIDQPGAGLQTGLDKPRYELTLITGKDRAIKHLSIGALKSRGTASEKPAAELSSDATYYARDDSRDELLVVDKYLVDKLGKTLADFRDKTIVVIERPKLKRIEIRFGEEQITLVKSDDKWLTPDQKKRAKSNKVSSMLNALEYGKARRIVDPPFDASKFGLDVPDVRITLEHEDIPKQELWLGKDGDGGTYAKLVGESSAKILEKDLRDKLKLKSADLLEDINPSKKP